MVRNWILIAVAPVALTACASNQGVQGAAVGAGVGALAGAVIGNNTGSGDAQTGALIGAVVGGAAGAYAGCQRTGGCGWNQNNRNHSELYYDRYSGRYWYEDYRDGSTWWENGEPRTAPRR
jgi:uncharacterized protein YcfJ